MLIEDRLMDVLKEVKSVDFWVYVCFICILVSLLFSYKYLYGWFFFSKNYFCKYLFIF